ncbi:MAG: hypothetical protein K6E51_02660 [Treponema sp.]|nr:hypothetical protein [Treponema sp.]
MANFNNRSGKSFVKCGDEPLKKSAVVKESKNGNKYACFGFMDKATGASYTFKVFLDTYKPTKDTAKHKDEDCCVVMIEKSVRRYNKPSYGYGKRF